MKVIRSNIRRNLSLAVLSDGNVRFMSLHILILTSFCEPLNDFEIIFHIHLLKSLAEAFPQRLVEILELYIWRLLHDSHPS